MQHLVQRRRARFAACTTRPAPHEEAKLVRCTAGAIFDVAVDLRAGSRDLSSGWVGVELSAENRLALYVPEGCAHGFLTLADDSEVPTRSPEPTPRTLPRRALGRSGVRDRLAGRGRRDQRARPHVPGLRRRRDGVSVGRLGHGCRRADARARARALPDLPQHHRRRRPGDAAPRSGSGSRSRCTRCRAARRSSTGPSPTSGTSATPTSRRGRASASSTSASRTSTSSATASRSREMTLDELRPHLHVHAEPGLDPVPDVVLHAHLGLLPLAAPLDALDGRAVRGRRRQHARAGLAHLRRVLPARRDGRRRCS